MKTLVTGATGFIGSELVRQLVQKGYDVRILRRRTSSLDLLGTVSSQVEHIIGDLRDPISIQHAVQGVSSILHVAAFVGFPGKKGQHKMHAVNVEGTAHVVNAALAAGTDRLVHTSSIAALGPPAQAKTTITENTRWRETDHTSTYARSKHQAELEVYRGHAEGLDTVIVNPSLVFGPEDPHTPVMQLINRLQQEKLPAVPPGSTNVVDVQDVAAGHIAALEQGRSGERYLLGSENLSWHEIARILSKALGTAPPRRTLPPTLLKGLGLLTETAAYLTRSQPRFSRNMAHAALSHHTYSNQKACQELQVEFSSFKETAARIAQAL